MGNKLPDNHNQWESNSCVSGIQVTEGDIDLIVKSIVNDLVVSVDTQHSIMSKENNKQLSETRKSIYNTSMDFEDTTYFESNETFSTPPSEKYDYTNEDSPNTSQNSSLNKTVVESNTPNDPFSPVLHIDREVTNVCKTDNPLPVNENENEYSPKRKDGSEYSRYNRVSPTSQNTSLSDWKSSSNRYSNNYNSDGPQFDNLLDYKKDSNRNNSKTLLSRFSLYRAFDPLITSEDSPKVSKSLSPSTPSPPELNDSTNLAEKFERFNLEDTPKSVRNVSNCPKPDVLEFAIKESTDTSIEKLEKLDKELGEKDILIKDLNEKLNESKEENRRLLGLISTLHYVNQDLYESSAEEIFRNKTEIQRLTASCDSLTSKNNEISEEKHRIEQRFYDLHLSYDSLRSDWTLSKESENSYQQQYVMAANKIMDLEKHCKELKEKNEIEKNKILNNEKKDMENELIATKVQYKKAEMKINSLQKQLDQKSDENCELSSMVDELILKVKK